MSKFAQLAEQKEMSMDDIVRDLWAKHQIKISRDTLYRWKETGITQAKTMKAIADVLGVGVENIID